jgi:hypothetical protein
MRSAIIRWTMYMAALLVVGPIAGLCTGWLRAPDGSSFAAPFASTEPVLGTVAAFGALALALVLGAVAGRLEGIRAGFTTAGLVVAWAAWRTGPVDQIVRANDSAGVLGRLAAEGLLFGAAGVALAVAISAVSKRDSHHLGGRLLAGTSGLAAIGVGVLAGAAIAWLVARTPLKGQAVAAAITGGVAIGAAGRLADLSATLPSLCIPIAVLAILGPLSGLVVGAGNAASLLTAGRNGTLFPLANILPLDWIAGGLLGIPLGVTWAASMIEKRTAPAS